MKGVIRWIPICWSTVTQSTGRRTVRSPVTREIAGSQALLPEQKGTDMIEVHQLAKHYGGTVAVDGLSFTVRPGRVTGFLGPNGAGQPVTMPVIAGLDEPTASRVRVNGRDDRAAPAPMAELGVLLEPKALHTGRPARNH